MFVYIQDDYVVYTGAKRNRRNNLYFLAQCKGARGRFEVTSVLARDPLFPFSLFSSRGRTTPLLRNCPAEFSSSVQKGIWLAVVSYLRAHQRLRNNERRVTLWNGDSTIQRLFRSIEISSSSGTKSLSVRFSAAAALIYRNWEKRSYFVPNTLHRVSKYSCKRVIEKLYSSSQRKRSLDSLEVSFSVIRGTILLWIILFPYIRSQYTSRST